MGDRFTRPDRFRLHEVAGDTTAGEQAEVLATARELEWLAATDDVAPGAGFADRVMAAIGTEPTPRPVVAAASAARRGAILGVFAAFGDLWRVAWSGGRPLAVRGPAMALVVLVLAGMLGVGALGVGALAEVGNGPDQLPTPAPVVSPAQLSASPSPSPSPEPSSSPSSSPGVTGTPEATETPGSTASPDASEETTATPRPTARPTPRPTASPTPPPTRTPEPTKTPDPSDPPDED